ncbi:unnamed protein product [Effrenium voratum]|uniref:NAD(P)-binding domain-containing protein n=1 Tax=Effrenium voratum TaxID=2562239 RepID=A0AA36JFP9_9DINO|nr:unnamed protein product [Effrenium voratum]
MATTIAIVWASRGGLGDVGKLAAMHAKLGGVQFRAVALNDGKEGLDTGIDTTEVVPETRREKLQEVLKDVEVKQLDITGDSTLLEEVFSGCDCIIACPGSRQNKIARTCALGAKKICHAAQKAGVPRIVVLSSFGVGADYLPCSCIGCIWGCLLRCAWPGMRRDLIEMDEIVASSGLEYLLVRPMGIDPTEQPLGSWKLVTAKGQGSLPITVAKEDVAQYLLREAVTPEHKSMSVTIGKDVAAKPPVSE